MTLLAAVIILADILLALLLVAEITKGVHNSAANMGTWAIVGVLIWNVIVILMQGW